MEMYAEVKKRVATCRSPEQRLKVYALTRAAVRAAIAGSPKSQLSHYQRAAAQLEDAIDRVESELMARDKARALQRETIRALARKRSDRHLKTLGALILIGLSAAIISGIVHDARLTPEQRAAEMKVEQERQKAYELAHQDEIMAQRHESWREKKRRDLAAAINKICDQTLSCSEHISPDNPHYLRALNALVDRDEAIHPDEWKSFTGTSP